NILAFDARDVAVAFDDENGVFEAIFGLELAVDFEGGQGPGALHGVAVFLGGLLGPGAHSPGKRTDGKQSSHGSPRFARTDASVKVAAPFTASRKRRRYARRGISTGSNWAVVGVTIWMSNRRKPRTRKCSTRNTSAALPPSVRRVNIDSPANSP